MPGPLDPTARQAIIDTRRDGGTYNDCAAAAGCSPAMVHRVLHQAGLIRVGLRDPLPDSVTQAVIAARNTGASYRQCAHTAGCSPAMVHRILHRAGLTGLPTVDQRADAAVARLLARLDAAPLTAEGCRQWVGRPIYTVPPALRHRPEWATGRSHQMRVARAALIARGGLQPGRATHTRDCALGAACVADHHLTWT